MSRYLISELRERSDADPRDKAQGAFPRDVIARLAAQLIATADIRVVTLEPL